MRACVFHQNLQKNTNSEKFRKLFKFFSFPSGICGFSSDFDTILKFIFKA